VKSPGVRVSSGSLRGRNLEVPDGVRPTEQKVREALFSILGDRLRDASLLDLFAGSGAVGIESVSRGALSATLVESRRTTLEALRRNLAITPAASVRVLGVPVEKALEQLRGRGETFDIVFADPPYAWIPDSSFFAGCVPLLRPGGVLTIEHSSRVALPIEVLGWVRTDERRYGESALSFYGRSEGDRSAGASGSLGA
jgi:16S rRNA (guanine966-N2)-methyltransferase